MEKVTTINLGGTAYQLEESGFDKLSAYLADARAKLAGNPDEAEILNDIELALAQKCRNYLKPQKNVITGAVVEKMLQEMGPVETDAGSEESAHDEQSKKEKAEQPKKKLYRIREGAMISGVCNGMAAYFDIDVTLVRIAFAAFAFITSGFGAGVYIILAMIIPVASTPEEKAQAQGAAPITTQALIDRAREGFENFKTSGEWRTWKKQLKNEAKQWRNQWKQEKHEQKWHYHQSYSNGMEYYSPFWSFMHSLLGMVWFVLISFGLWFAYHHSAFAHDIMDSIGMAFEQLSEKLGLFLESKFS